MCSKTLFVYKNVYQKNSFGPTELSSCMNMGIVFSFFGGIVHILVYHIMLINAYSFIRAGLTLETISFGNWGALVLQKSESFCSSNNSNFGGILMLIKLFISNNNRSTKKNEVYPQIFCVRGWKRWRLKITVIREKPMKKHLNSMRKIFLQQKCQRIFILRQLNF